jgi:Type II secretion system (T2SS), protein M subtype b
MSRPTSPPPTVARLRQRISTIHKTRRHNSLGLAEVIGLGIGGLLLLAAVVGYLSFMAPAQARVSSLLLERDRLQKQLRISQDDFRNGMDTKSRVQEITDSLGKFETVNLIDRTSGRMLLYAELNELIRKNGLRNTSGPTYTGLEPLGSRNAQQTAAVSNSTATKWQSIYPGIAVNVTLEGPYQSLRHFVRELESSKEFIVINGVELEQATQANAQAAAGAPRVGASDAPVSLRMDLAIYFQRSNGTVDKGGDQETPAH